MYKTIKLLYPLLLLLLSGIANASDTPDVQSKTAEIGEHGITAQTVQEKLSSINKRIDAAVRDGNQGTAYIPELTNIEFQGRAAQLQRRRRRRTAPEARGRGGEPRGRDGPLAVRAVLAPAAVAGAPRGAPHAVHAVVLAAEDHVAGGRVDGGHAVDLRVRDALPRHRAVHDVHGWRARRRERPRCGASACGGSRRISGPVVSI